MHSQLINLHHRAQWLSLDVALAALGGGVLAERVMYVRMPWAWYVVLPAAVWCVYTLDHLLDARRVGSEASTPRHRFHHRHFELLAALCMVVSVGAVTLAVIQLHLAGLWLGTALSAAVLIHLGLTHLAGNRASPMLMKEWGVGVIFTAGIWSLPAAHHGLSLRPATWLLAIQYFLLVMMNLIVFAWYEHPVDATDGHTSFVRGIGPDRVPALMGSLLLGVVAFAAAAIFLRPIARVAVAEAIYLVMAMILTMLLMKPTWFGRSERYRLWGDGVFLLPWFILLAG